MRAFLGAATVLLGAVLWPHPVRCQLQSGLNPEISFIADTRAISSNAEAGDVELVFDELEIGAEGFLNPFARASVFAGIHDGSIEVEEAYVTFVTLPANLGLRVGRYLVDAGRFVPQHPHAFSFLDYPQFVGEYFTAEGLSETGLNPSILIDLAGLPLTVSANVLSGNVHEDSHEAEADSTAHEERGARFFGELTYTGRASLFLELTRSTNLEIAGHGGTRVADVHEGHRNVWFGGDYKLKWRPHRRTSFEVAGEIIVHRGDLEPAEAGTITSETSVGTFHYLDYQLSRQWNAGALVDYAQHALDSGEDMLGLGLFAGYSLFEESTVIRLLVRHDDFSDDPDPRWSLQLQLVFGLGPHKPHVF